MYTIDQAASGEGSKGICGVVSTNPGEPWFSPSGMHKIDRGAWGEGKKGICGGVSTTPGEPGFSPSALLTVAPYTPRIEGFQFEPISSPLTDNPCGTKKML